MENLVLLGERRRRLDVPTSNPHSQLTQESTLTDLCTVVAPPEDLGSAESSACTVLLTENGVLTKVTDSGNVVWTCHLQEESEIDSGWFKVDFVDPELVCLSKRGAIVTVNPTTGEADLVGVFDQGLEDAVWSPDGETLLMVTSTEEEGEDDPAANDDNNNPPVHSRLMTMNSQFEVLAEVTIPRYVPSSGNTDADISLAWRPDGALCGVSSIDAEDGIRKIRIYKRESLELHAIGRAEDASGALVKNLQKAAIAWAGTGCSQLLAGVQRKGKKTHQVVFFEPNGLRHREFLLREDPTTNVLMLAWNATSDLLAVGLREQGGLDKIQLWHRMNYHWYLKREFRYPGQHVERLKFSQNDPHELCVLLQGLEWREYEVRWDPSTTVVLPGICNAFVVDGSSLNETEFHKALIPPPMYAKCHSFDSIINEITFCYDQQYLGSGLISLSSGILSFLHLGSDSLDYVSPRNVFWKDLQGNDPSCFRSFVITKTELHRLYFVCVTSASFNEDNERLLEGVVEDLNSPEPKAYIKQSYKLSDRVLRTTRWLDATGGCLLQLRNRSLLEYDFTGPEGSLIRSETEPLLESCPWIFAIKDGSSFATSFHGELERPRFVFGLSARSRLYFLDAMLTDAASSFTVSLTHEFLCYVTKGSRCQARFLPLSEIHSYDPLMGMDQGHLLEGYEPRSVEQGARVVTVLPENPQMILQMPRGNLEGIHPRALLLRYVMKKVLAGSFGEAYRMMRKHKVDLNIIVDLDPKGFLENGISTFIKEVDNIDHLNLFISNLQNYDVTQSRFPVPSWLRKKDIQIGVAQFDFTTKVNQVCVKAREVMLLAEGSGEKASKYFLLPILSTFAKEDPPKLGEALNLIKEDAMKQSNKSSAKNPLFAESAQHSIHYLAFLAEYELLFETSLGMYDYDVARAVARNSQMDPKVYLPLLKRYNALPRFFSRYEVDIRLKRYDLALRNLYASYLAAENLENTPGETNGGMVVRNSFEDCLVLIEEHNLHKIGLELFQNDLERKRTILIALGDSLMKQSQPKTALSVYFSAAPPELEGAKRAASAAKDWKCFFSLMMEPSPNESVDANESVGGNIEIRSEKRRQVAREIAADIATSSGFSPESMRESCLDAARILVDYGDDLIGAIDYFIQAESWSEGYRVAALKGRDDLKKKVVDGAVSFGHVSIGNFADRVGEFETANNRYAEVLKLRKQNVHLEGPDPALDVDETGSLFSTASTASNMSLRSTASASSTGSGVSSIISVKTTTTFQMTGAEDIDRHRSKFNKGKKKKQRKTKKKPRQKPGSEEELQELVGVMKASCPNSHYASTISDTIRFLIFGQQTSLAEEVYRAYKQMCEAIDKAKTERMEAHANEKIKAAAHTRTEGDQHDLSHLLVDLPVEKKVDEMTCAPLDAELLSYFDFVLLVDDQ